MSAKELAAAMDRSVRWVYAAKARGFPMPGGRASLTELREWLLLSPCAPTSRRFPFVQSCS